MSGTALCIEGVTKTYKGVQALKNATLCFEPGEIHALLGENGAGKSTLCKVLSGSIVPDAGRILVNGGIFERFTPTTAKAQGIEMIYQEFNLVPELTVYENLFLGKEIRKGLLLRKKQMIERARQVFEQLNISLDPTAQIKNLSVAYCQMVEIGKSMMEDAKYLIMDEPTAPLTVNEVDNLLRLVRQLRDRGVTIIYISHRIEELLELSDRITVMRDGAVIKTLVTKETNKKELIRLMVGRELGTDYPVIQNDGKMGEPLLRVEHLQTKMLHDVSFEVHGGEIVGLAGLVGAGRTETVRAIFGADPILSGKIWLKGRCIQVRSPEDAIRYGIALVPEDRKRQGVHLELPIGLNISLIKIKRLCRCLTISARREETLIEEYRKRLSIKMASFRNNVSSLSGGNQQKVVLAKWLSIQSDVLFLDEPTRGVDVSAKKEIYDLMERLRSENKAIVMISSEMPEVIGMCNRVLVMHEGRIQGELKASETTQERILELASGY